jgi:hypothetical protein
MVVTTANIFYKSLLIAANRLRSTRKIFQRKCKFTGQFSHIFFIFIAAMLEVIEKTATKILHQAGFGPTLCNNTEQLTFCGGQPHFQSDRYGLPSAGRYIVLGMLQ